MVDKEKSLERRLSEEEFRDVIARAESLQVFDEARKDKQHYGSALDSLSLGEGVSVSRTYEIAKQLDIQEAYLKRALVPYQSKEEMLRDLNKIGAKPSQDILNYHKSKDFSGSFLNSLRSTFPLDEFKVINMSSDNGPAPLIFDVRRIGPKKGLFKIRERETIVGVNLYNRQNYVGIYSPLFVAACARTLQKLEGKYGFIEKTFHYDVLPDEKL